MSANVVRISEILAKKKWEEFLKRTTRFVTRGALKMTLPHRKTTRRT